MTLIGEQDDTLCFELSEAKNILKYAEKGYFCDSLIFHYEKKDSLLREAIALKDEELLLAQRIIEAQIVEINNLEKKNKRLKYIIVGVGTACFIELILIVKK